MRLSALVLCICCLVGASTSDILVDDTAWFHDWLRAQDFSESIVKSLDHYTLRDAAQLTKQDAKDIFGVAEGIRFMIRTLRLQEHNSYDLKGALEKKNLSSQIDTSQCESASQSQRRRFQWGTPPDMHIPSPFNSSQGWMASFSKRRALDATEGVKTVATRRMKYLRKKLKDYLRHNGFAQNDKDYHKCATLTEAFCTSSTDQGCDWEEYFDLFESQCEQETDEVTSQYLQRTMRYMSQSLPTSNEGKLDGPSWECPRLDEPITAEKFLNDYVRVSRPVILRGIVSNWTAHSKWSLPYFLDKVGEEHVKVYASLDGSFESIAPVGDWDDKAGPIDVDYFQLANIPKADPEEKIMLRPAETMFRFRDFVRQIDPREDTKGFSEPLTLYLQKHPLEKWPHLLDDQEPSLVWNPKSFTRFLRATHHLIWMSGAIPDLAKEEEFDPELYVGPQENAPLGQKINHAPIHYDPNENLHTVVRGTKVFEMFHPLHNDYMYENEASYRSGHLLYEWDQDQGGVAMRLPVEISPSGYQPFSPVNLTNPDYEKYPKYRNHQKMICTVREGETLFLPSFWWHEVTSYLEHSSVVKARMAKQNLKTSETLGHGMGMNIGITHFYHPIHAKLNNNLFSVNKRQYPFIVSHPDMQKSFVPSKSIVGEDRFRPPTFHQD